MIEDKFKNVLGELTFQSIFLQHELEEAKKKIAELESKNDKNNSK